MKKLTFLAGIFVLAFSFFTVVNTKAQNRKSVTASEVTGTFRSNFADRFKDFSNEIKILALGKGKLKVSFELIYPYVMSDGKPMANMGEAKGTATIIGDTAIYSSDEYGSCKITIKFVRLGLINVIQNGVDSECGFGFNVSASGTYKKVGNTKPKF